MQIQTVPRASLNLWLSAVRLPVTLTERLLGRAGESSVPWPPALAFDSVGASIRQVVGSVLHDPALTEQAEAEHARVAQLRKAFELEMESEAKRAQADREFGERRARDEKRKQAASERADQRLEAAERKRQQADARIEAEARKAEEEQREREDAIARSVTKQERNARATRVAKERAAVAKAKKATAKTAEVVELDAKLQRSKRARTA
jgi:hypothetical protein